MLTTPVINTPTTPKDSALSKTITLAGIGELREKEPSTTQLAESPDNVVLDLITENIRQEFIALRIDGKLEQEAGNPNPLQEIRETAKAVIAKSRRGEEAARGRYEFPVLADKGDRRRKVTIDITLDEIQLRIKGVAAQNGRDGLIKEIGEYVSHTRPKNIRDTDKVNHYITGRFAPARIGEPLVVIDNTVIRGKNGIDCQGRPIYPRPGNPRQVEYGPGVRKDILAPAKFQLVSMHTGIAVPVYNSEGVLQAIDVKESVQIGEVGLRQGGHVAIKGAHGRAKELEIEDTKVDSVGRAFKIRTSGKVIVSETVYGEVVANDILATMINAEGKLVAARNAIKVDIALQTSAIYAQKITIGKWSSHGSIINSACHARHNFTALNARFLGRNTVVLGNDIARENHLVVSGSDLLATRQRTIKEQLNLQKNWTM